MFGLSLLRGSVLDRTPKSKSRSWRKPVARHCRFECHVEDLENRQLLSSITFTAGNPATNLNAAQVVFDHPDGGTDLTVTLTNTSTHVFDASSKLTPTNVLGGVLFDITGSPTLTVGSANLAPGTPTNHMVNYTGTLPDPSPNGWAFGTPTGGTFNGQHYGIESFGGITGGHSNFTNSNGSAIQGSDYGIVGSGYVPGTGNGQLPTTPFEQTAEVFHFTGVAPTFDVSQIGNVSFQYGTANGELPAAGTASPAIVTTASASPDTVVGSAMLTDTAHLTGGSFPNGTPGGTITFTLTDPNGQAVTLPTEDASMTVTGNGDYTTPTPILATLVGAYHWTASYSGNPNNNPASEPATDTERANETVTTVKASPTISTSASETAGGVVGTAVLSDSATISGGYHVDAGTPAPTITFTLDQPDGTTITVGTVTVTGTGTYDAPTVTATQVGKYTWHASYSGNGLNNGAIDDGTNESLTTVAATVIHGFTRGFWGNQNGHAVLNNTDNHLLPQTIGTPGTTVIAGYTGREITVHNTDESDTVLGGTYTDALGLTDSLAGNNGTQHLQTLQTLEGQTLALQYNTKYPAINGFSSQTVGQVAPGANLSQLGAFAGLPALSTSSTITQVLTYANELVWYSASGGLTTQDQAGAMNTLLGLINTEQA